MLYNATAALRARTLTDDHVDELLDQFANYHAIVSGTPSGGLEVVFTFPAENLAQALSTAQALVGHLDLVGLEVLETTEWDRRVDAVDVPPLVSVTEAAQMLGVSRQAVAQRLEAGSLPGQRVGTIWVIARGDVLARMPSE